VSNLQNIHQFSAPFILIGALITIAGEILGRSGFYCLGLSNPQLKQGTEGLSFAKLHVSHVTTINQGMV